MYSSHEFGFPQNMGECTSVMNIYHDIQPVPSVRYYILQDYEIYKYGKIPQPKVLLYNEIIKFFLFIDYYKLVDFTLH